LRFRVSALGPAAGTTFLLALLAADGGGYFPQSWGWAGCAVALVAAACIGAGRPPRPSRLELWFVGAFAVYAAWTGISIMWSIDRTASVYAFERALLLLAGSAAFLALAGRRDVEILTVVVVGVITTVCGYALWTRLFPSASSFDPADPVTGYRLFAPLGYWNALGAYAAVGLVAAFALLARGRVAMWEAAVAGIAGLVLPLTLFFTFSRGAWAAGAVGAIVAVALSPSPARLLVRTVIGALAPTAAIIAAADQPALTHIHATLPGAIHEGHRLALVCGFLAVFSIVAIAAATRIPVPDRVIRVRMSRRARAAVIAVTVSTAVVVLVVASLGFGERFVHTFAEPTPPPEPVDVSRRVLDLNGNGRAQMWKVALEAADGHWVAGRGAGSFQRSWERSRRSNEVVHDAHGLYVQTITELGVVGLVALVAALCAPLVAGLRSRRSPLAGPLTGAYVVFVSHNAVDWDWRLTGLALTGLVIGGLLLLLSRPLEVKPLAVRWRMTALGVSCLIAGAMAVAGVGNGALAHARAAAGRHDYAAAVGDAALARRFMPWSAEPIDVLGEAEFRAGDIRAARQVFADAVRKDPNGWRGWLDLAAATQGRPRRAAVDRARALYPNSPEVREFLEEVAAKERVRPHSG
jgi:hypothetical protein